MNTPMTAPPRTIPGGPAALAGWGLMAWRLTHAPLDAEPSGIGGGFAFFAAMLVVAGITSLLAFVALLIDVFTNPNVSPDQRMMWVLVLLFANLIGFPVYWYGVWWRRPRLTAAR